MSEAVSLSGQVLRTLANAFEPICDVATCTFASEGLSIQAMDQSHVTLLSATVSSHDMEAYTFCNRGGASLAMTIDFGVIKNALKPSGRRDKISMKIGTARRQRRQTIGIVSDDFIATFAITPAKQEPETPFAIPVLPPASSVSLVLNTGLFRELFVKTSDKVTISATLLTVKIGDKEFAVDSEVVTKTVADTRVSFYARYFGPFCKGAKAAGASSICVLICNDRPGEFRYKIGTRSCITLYVAPMIDDKDEAAEPG